MDLLQPIARLLIFPALRLKNRNTDLKYLREVERSQYLPPDVLGQHQLHRLRRLLVHAAAQCPFYARRFGDAGFDPSRIGNVHEIERIPLLTKRDIQRNHGEMVARGIEAADLVENQTGGSTGAPLRFFMNRDSVYRRIANTIRHDRWAGLEPYHRAAAIWGHRRDLLPPRSVSDRLRDALVNRRIMLDSSSISEEALRRFVVRLRQTRPSTYIAYANSIYLLARYIKETGIRDYHRPKSIITSAELLASEQRQLIEEVFECPVFNRYGARECSVIASECDRHEGMHVAADSLLVEVVRGDRQCTPGMPGNIVVTDLYNFGMPFIRYRIEDVGALCRDRCSCGRSLPLMTVLGGRVTDFLVTPKGGLVSGAALTIYFIARVPGIAQAQIVQRADKRLLLRFVAPDGVSTEARTAVAEAMQRFFGSTVSYEVELVDAIPQETSGKYRFSICELDPLEALSRPGVEVHDQDGS